jgi:PAS domain S-box-containing protein
MALRAHSEASLRRLQTENERLAEELANVTHADSDGAMDPNVFRDLLQAAADGILVVAPTGRILACNPALAEMFGYRPDDLVGQLVNQLIPESHREGHIQYVGEYFGAPSRRRMGHQLFTPGLRKDKSEFAVSITLGAHETLGGNYTVCMVRDATPELELLLKHAPHIPEAAAFTKSS